MHNYYCGQPKPCRFGYSIQSCIKGATARVLKELLARGNKFIHVFSIYYFYCCSYVQIKCLKYWPSASPEMYGPVLVSPGDEEELADYVVRKFTIQMVRVSSVVILSLL